MNLENCKLIMTLPIKSGTSVKGEWCKQDLIFETTAKYPKQICVSIWGDKIDNEQYTVGDSYNLGIELESREYKGNWYTDIKAWKIESITKSETISPIENDIEDLDDSLKDLPF